MHITETEAWNLEEIEAYHQALMKCDKDFYNISKQVHVVFHVMTQSVNKEANELLGSWSYLLELEPIFFFCDCNIHVASLSYLGWNKISTSVCPVLLFVEKSLWR